MNLRKFRRHLIAFAICFGMTGTANALSITLGNQDFTDGQLLPLNTYEAAQIGESGTFSFSGSDAGNGSNFARVWQFNYAPMTVTSASITLGIYDHDSAASGEQVQVFSVDGGNDFTAALNSLFDRLELVPREENQQSNHAS
jgi:hypothetical protein